MTAKAKEKVGGVNPATPQITAAVELQSQGKGLFDTAGLLENCRTKWQLGEWTALAAFGELEISQDPDREKVAVLVAAAHGQLGHLDQASKYISLSLEWGCSREIVARVMISSVENSLGRAALQLGAEDQALGFFQSAVSLVEAKADAGLLAKTRQIREMARCGMLQQARDLVEKDLATIQQEGSRRELPAWPQAIAERIAILSQETLHLATPEEEAQPELPALLLKNPLFDERAFRHYSGETDGVPENFLYVETKSLPRSGLHYLRNTLRGILAEGFSFCEWYNEPGCCRAMPCAMTSYAETGGFHLRLLKSHDFEMADPVLPVAGAMQRLVLIRDPLAILTSWWTLHLLQLNQKLLSDHGIALQKIYYQHDKPVIHKAYRILERHAVMPTSEVLRTWLHQQQAYMAAFMQKWAGLPNTRIVNYVEMPQVVLELLRPWEDKLDEGACRRLDRFRESGLKAFTPRSSAFVGPVEKITSHLEEHAPLFHDAVTRILEADSSGRLAKLHQN